MVRVVVLLHAYAVIVDGMQMEQNARHVVVIAKLATIQNVTFQLELVILSVT